VVDVTDDRHPHIVKEVVSLRNYNGEALEMAGSASALQNAQTCRLPEIHQSRNCPAIPWAISCGFLKCVGETHRSDVTRRL